MQSATFKIAHNLTISRFQPTRRFRFRGNLRIKELSKSAIELRIGAFVGTNLPPGWDSL